MGSPTFAKVRPAERQQAIDVIVSAFAGDPFVRNLYPDDESYMRHFPKAVVAFGGLALDAGTVWRIGEFDGVAFWYPPDLSPDDAIIEHFRLTVSAERLDDIFSTFDQMDHAHPAYRHWYLPWFGVHASRQGRGIGGDLLRRCLARVDADHLPAYLENTNPRNRSFYERHGFVQTGESQAGVAPPIFSMVRDSCSRHEAYADRGRLGRSRPSLVATLAGDDPGNAVRTTRRPASRVSGRWQRAARHPAPRPVVR